VCPPLDISGAVDPSNPHDRTACGRLAEDLVASFLRIRGFRILERNWRDGPRETDLIAHRGEWLVVVEVRLRSRTDRGLPEETIHPAKRRDLLRAGRSYWLRRGRELGRLRFDLIALHLTPEGLILRHYPHFLNPGE
jgi:putative endonuclease